MPIAKTLKRVLIGFDRMLKMNPVLRRILQLLLLVFVQAVLLFASAGSLTWGAGWLYIGLYVLMLAVASLVILPGHQDVVVERSKGTSGAKAWDLWVTRLVAIPSLGVLIVAGLDWRWGWTPPYSIWLTVLGGLGFVLGYVIVVWAMLSNPFFAQVVRIQADRGHVAVTDGPYRLIRHPGYFGMMISFLGSIFLLGSLYGLICFAFYVIVVVIRTALEDKTLRAELPGYVEYSARTRYRLMPGVW